MAADYTDPNRESPAEAHPQTKAAAAGVRRSPQKSHLLALTSAVEPPGPSSAQPEFPDPAALRAHAVEPPFAALP